MANYDDSYSRKSTEREVEIKKALYGKKFNCLFCKSISYCNDVASQRVGEGLGNCSLWVFDEQRWNIAEEKRIAREEERLASKSW